GGGVQVGQFGGDPGLADLGRGLFGPGPVGVPGDTDVQSGLGQGDRGGPPDSRVRRGDDGMAWLKSHAPLTSPRRPPDTYVLTESPSRGRYKFALGLEVVMPVFAHLFLVRLA